MNKQFLLETSKKSRKKNENTNEEYKKSVWEPKNKNKINTLKNESRKISKIVFFLVVLNKTICARKSKKMKPIEKTLNNLFIAKEGIKLSCSPKISKTKHKKIPSNWYCCSF